MELLQTRAGIKLHDVPDPRGSQMVQDVLSGQVAATWSSGGAVAGFVREGKLRVLGIAGRRRDPILPEVPTMDEAGLKDFRAVAWFALFAPRRTPVAILDRMHDEVQAALDADDVKKVWAEQGAKVELESRAEFGRFIDQEIVRWNRVAERRQHPTRVDAMKIDRRAALGGVAALLAAPAARARDWPEKTVTWVMPFPAGGPSDGFARTVAELVSAELGQTVVIDNRSGAGGNLGAAVVSHAAPDGYTMLVGFTGNAYASLIYANPGFDLLRDFEPISAIDRVQSVLLVNPKRLDVTTLAQFLEGTRQPDSIDMASGGLGTVGASRDRAPADRGEDQAAPRALSRRRAGLAGSAGRAGGRPVRDRRADGELRPRRHLAGACRSRPAARVTAARRADLQGGGRRRLPGDLVGWPVRAQGHAGADPRSRARRRAEGPGDET